MDRFNDNNEIRINKYLSMSGYCSRRAADCIVSEGRVTVDGSVATMGTKVSHGAIVKVDNTVISLCEECKVYAFNKPVGYISSLSDEQGEGIGKFIPPNLRLYPVGRLDKDSEGLMLLTNDGELMNSILKADGGHEKEYIVTVDHGISEKILCDMERGVRITNGATGKKVITAPCATQFIDNRHFRIILIQGLNRQIRRMCGFFGYKVQRLQRIRIMNIRLDNLKYGEIREITGSELMKLKSMTE